MWELMHMLGGMLFSTWVWASCFNAILRAMRPDSERRVLRWLRSELRPFALPLFLLSYIASIASGDSAFGSNLVLVLNAICWWVWRKDKDNDDRWKRRREKLASKVSEVGGRLQVVPAESGA